MPRQPRIPSCRLHRPSGQAVVRIQGRDIYLGKYGSQASQERYRRVIAEHVLGAPTPGTSLPARNELSINELMLAFYRDAERCYRRADGTPTSELGLIRLALRPLKDLYGSLSAREFGPLKFKAVREEMIHSELARSTINGHMDRIKRVFRWGVENELVPPPVYQGLRAVEGLRRGRSDARETEPVRPVAEAFVDAVLCHLRPPVAAMVQLQRFTGMRPGEVTIMRACDLEMGGNIWVYRPASHKTQHHGHQRVIYLGPKAQAVLRPFLTTDLTAYLFRPADAEAHRNQQKRQQRKTPLWPSHLRHQQRRKARRRHRQYSDHYDVNAYRRAIQYACKKAGVPSWHPHQLRHNAATHIRREFGLDAARAVLGHRSVAITEIYAEVDGSRAAEVMARIG